MKNKKLTLIILLILLICASLLGYLFLRRGKTKTGIAKPAAAPQTRNEKSYLLDGYPLKAVPLYKMKEVSSSKYFVNDDPTSRTGYFGKPVNYYNVVFETEATPKELLGYYRSLMDEVNEEFKSDESVEGKIGAYKIAVSHYGDNPKNYAYLQVYLPADKFQKTNRYYQEYPGIVELDKTWTEHESSYGLLNQKGGEIEYTQYFPMPKEEEAKDSLIKSYQEKYGQETDYSLDEKSGLMAWKKDGHSISMTFSRSHGRIYLMIRKPM